MTESCILCDLVEGAIPRWVVYETERLICFLPLELNPYGHTVIAPKEHFADLYDIPETLLQQLAGTAKRLVVHYRKAIGATGVNLLHASGRDAQQSVPHFHLHLLPRFPEDGRNERPDLPFVAEDKDVLLAKLRM